MLSAWLKSVSKGPNIPVCSASWWPRTLEAHALSGAEHVNPAANASYDDVPSANSTRRRGERQPEAADYNGAAATDM